jgi:hypothetical protein
VKRGTTELLEGHPTLQRTRPFDENTFKGILLEELLYDSRKKMLQENFGDGEELLDEQHIVKRFAIPCSHNQRWTLKWYHPARSWNEPSIPDIVVEHLGHPVLQEEAKNWKLTYETSIGHFESHIAPRFENQPQCPNRNLIISKFNPTPDSLDAINRRLNELHIKVLELHQVATEDNLGEVRMLLEKPEFTEWLDNLAVPTQPSAQETTQKRPKT